MKMRNYLREKINEKGYVIGAFVASCNPTNVEILAMNGMDFAILDMEHSPLGLETMVDMIRAGETYGMVSIPRVYTMETKLMRRILDVGAHGIMVPMVGNGSDAKYIMDAVKFPPLGLRGMNAGRGPRWGAYENYLSEANDALFTICQCETVEGLENIDKIAGTPGVDCVFIGTGDLSLDMGHPNDLKHPDVVEAIDKIRRTCEDAGVIPGIVTSTPEDAARRIKEGFKIVTIMNDLGMFKKQSLLQIEKVHELCDE
ncbi:HpcH/HpaI aldolase family protein [Frisingicoccus sp.]|uniref:HpcH/HpaI aldolase family protein n=1 Tax=Frisingicoccus sp. TaxID=1918627 RepID=UPI003AB8EAD6